MYRLTALLFAVLVAAPPAAARSMTAQDLARAGNFAERIQKVFDQGMAMSAEMDTARDYIDDYQAGDLEAAEIIDEQDQAEPAEEMSPEAFTEALDPFLAGMREAIEDYRARYPRAPSSPSIGSEPHERILGGFAKTVVGLGGLLDRQLGVLHGLRAAALARDEDAYAAATADSTALAADLKLAENRSLEASLVAMERGHPQVGLVKTVIGGNRVMAVALRVMEAGYRGRDFDIVELALELETGLRDAGRAIVEGERAARAMLKSLEGKFAQTDADRYKARFTGELVKSYGRAFAVEREILDLQRGLLDFLRAVNAGEEDPEDALDAVLEFQEVLDELVELRDEETAVRQEMTDEYARVMDGL